ncbi:MAG: hypothetical protein KIT72_12030 [Polyangiaceae bacterium]|nr:hypothetical protein [Polyangiaceae bacterium]MCW5791143.1 hypothetical protein [Polyangiaceae bacterium]
MSRGASRGVLQYLRWLLVPAALLLVSGFWPSWPRTHVLVLDATGQQLKTLDVSWSIEGEAAPRGGASWRFEEGGPAPGRLRHTVEGPSGDWQIEVRRLGRASTAQTTSQHRVTLDGEETVLFLEGP